MEERGILEGSLAPHHKIALDLYRKQTPRFDTSIAQLKPWQQQAMELFNNPSERQVIWIRGARGYEGKSWFQDYVEGYFGYHRVARVDLRIKHANMCNVLKKRTLGTIDIFLFNDARSISGEEINLYRILEDIKDGHATASKYDNDNIKFKTPNTVMIFSNDTPNRHKLSKDRWNKFDIHNDELRQR